MRYAFSILMLVMIGSAAWPCCWKMVDPDVFAQDCPIVVAGTIEEVKQAAAGGERDDDIAKIRIDVVFRNDLTDVALKAGDSFPVRMISNNNRMRMSTDLNYPVKTKAVWLVKLTSKGEFRIDVHPVQKQPHQLEPKLEFGVREVLSKAVRDSKEPAPKLANPKGTKSKAEWITAMKREEERREKDRVAYAAQQKAIRDLAKVFADADELTAAEWKRYHDSDIEVRRSMLQLSIHEQPMSGLRFAEVAKGVLQQEKDDNVRTHAVSQLAYCRDPGFRGRDVLEFALSDKSASVRMFACQSLKIRRYERSIDLVKQLLNDPDKQVREMAASTLEFWAGGKSK